jgi:phosphate transport system permease protein
MIVGTLGIARTIYIFEVAHSKVADLMRSLIETLAGIFSVIFGLFGLILLIPRIQEIFNLPARQNTLTRPLCSKLCTSHGI